MKDVHKEYGGRKRNRCLRMSTTMELACTLAETYSPQDNIVFAPVKIKMDFIHTMFKTGNSSCLKTRQYHLELGIWLLQQVNNPIFHARALFQHAFYWAGNDKFTVLTTNYKKSYTLHQIYQFGLGSLYVPRRCFIQPYLLPVSYWYI